MQQQQQQQAQVQARTLGMETEGEVQEGEVQEGEVQEGEVQEQEEQQPQPWELAVVPMAWVVAWEEPKLLLLLLQQAPEMLEVFLPYRSTSRRTPAPQHP